MYLCSGFVCVPDKGTITISWREDSSDRGYEVKFEGKQHKDSRLSFHTRTMCDGRKMLVMWDINQYPSLEYEIYDVRWKDDPEHIIDAVYEKHGVLSDLKRASRY